jgi:hypothetical protein
MSNVRFLARASDFSLLHNIKTSSETHQPSYAMDTMALSSTAPPSSTKVKNRGAILPLPPYIITVQFLVNQSQGQLHIFIAYFLHLRNRTLGFDEC